MQDDSASLSMAMIGHNGMAYEAEKNTLYTPGSNEEGT
jgi:hypothetical protein